MNFVSFLNSERYKYSGLDESSEIFYQMLGHVWIFEHKAFFGTGLYTNIMLSQHGTHFEIKMLLALNPPKNVGKQKLVISGITCKKNKRNCETHEIFCLISMPFTTITNKKQVIY